MSAATGLISVLLMLLPVPVDVFTAIQVDICCA